MYSIDYVLGTARAGIFEHIGKWPETAYSDNSLPGMDKPLAQQLINRPLFRRGL
jgi:hypothetical protein